MPTPIDPKRLPALRAALKRVKPGEKLPQQELAKLYGVTNARLTTLIKQRFASFPEPERKGDKTHWYEARPAIEAMIAYLTGAATRRTESAKLAAAVITGAKAEAAVAPEEKAEPEKRFLTPQDLDKTASAATRIFRLRQEQRQFVRADLTQGLFRSLFTTVQRSISNLPMDIDPNGELPPLMRNRLEEAARDALLRVHASIKDVLGDDAAA